MKKRVLLAVGSVVCAISFSAHASEKTYVNDAGCSVVAEQHANGTVYYVQKAGDSVTVGVTKDAKSADFVYCSQKEIAVNSISGPGGTGIMISCSEHQNDHGITRGRVDLDLDSTGGVRSISVDGQSKGFLGFWSQETKIVCNDLELKK
ncbi:MAG: hypothetical protein JNJ49_13255 [Bdellovibrionaceae bacterium]|nr:hypothetical protein [Pseudobdellovibrionaceae bacterium]